MTRVILVEDEIAVAAAVEDQLRNVAEHLEQLGTQVLALSHSTVAPLAAIKGLAEAIKDDLDEGVADRRFDLIIAEVERADHRLRRLRRVAQLTASEVTPNLVCADLWTILRDRVAPFVVLLEARRVTVELAVPTGEFPIETDPDLLGDVFAELASNAMSAIQRSTERPATPSFRIFQQPSDDMQAYVLVFQNSGPTISLENQDDVFGRIDSLAGGTGMGLRLVRQMLVALGGDVSYHVNEDGLSEFHVRLPRPFPPPKSCL